MDSIIRTLMKRLILLSACTVGLMILVAREFARGLLSPRGLGIAHLVLSIAVGVWAVLIVKKAAKAYTVLPIPSGTALDPVTRKRRLVGVRVGQVGAAVNLCIIAVVIRVVVQLQRSLN
jgi:hypothetical protein